MPYANPQKSFDTSARHLFRHLHDAAMLRRNPLTAGYFRPLVHEDAAAEYEVLLAVRDDVRRIARSLCADDMSAGLEATARRAAAIIENICLGRSPARSIRDLGISRRQYYRDRRAICRRVAAELRASGANGRNGARVDEPLRLEIQRSAALTSQGLAATAAARLECVARTALPGSGKVLALLGLAGARVDLGEFDEARKLIHVARASANATAPDRVSAHLRDRVALAQANLATARNCGHEASRTLEDLYLRLCERDAAGDADPEFALDIALEVGFNRLNEQRHERFDQVRDALACARRIARRMGRLSPAHDVSLALLFAAAVEDGADRDAEQYARFEAALELCIDLASPAGTVYSSLWLEAHCAMRGLYDLAHDHWVRARSVARTADGTELLFAASLHGAGILVETPRWRSIEPALAEVQSLPLDAEHWVRLTDLRGELLLRAGRHAEAVDVLEAAEFAARGLHSKRRHASTLLGLAVGLTAVGRGPEAQARIRDALDLSEAYGTPWSRYRASSTASRYFRSAIEPDFVPARVGTAS